MVMPKYALPIAERFWSKVDKSDNGCWEWLGSRFNGRYGQFSFVRRVEGVKTSLLSHRVAWTLTYGPIPPNTFVCHHCDNPICVRPDHLFLGSAKDNTQDAVEKGRVAHGTRHWSRTQPERFAETRAPFLASRVHYRGEQHGRARLNWNQVREIRQRYAAGDETYASLGREFGVSDANVRAIVKGWTWKELSGNYS
jgi:hypothetical protein